MSDTNGIAPETAEAIFGHEEVAEVASGEAEKDLSESARYYIKLREEEDALDAQRKAKSEQVRLVEDLILSTMEAKGLKSLRLDTGELLTSVNNTDYRLPNEGTAEREAVIAWLSRIHAKHLVQKTVHWKKFESLCKERAEAGHKIHEAVKINPRKTLSLRRS